MLILTSCPECASPAEVTEWFELASTDGPVQHLAMRCTGSHLFRLPVDSLPAETRQAFGEPPFHLADPRGAGGDEVQLDARGS